MRSYQNQLVFEPQLAPTTSERYRNKRALKVSWNRKSRKLPFPPKFKFKNLTENGGRRQQHKKVSKK
jgi:hypothetical protein